MNKFILVLIIAVFAVPLGAETLEFERYNWETFPKLNIITADEKREGAVIILDKRLIELTFDNSNTAVVYHTRHVIIHLNTDFSIEYYNKIYVAMTDVKEVVEFNARFISKDGRVYDMDTRNMRSVENYNNKGPYRIYAFEGIEVGGEIEYIYTIKKGYHSFGTESYRSIYNYRSIMLDIYSPKDFRYDGKTYNGLSPVEEWETEGSNGKSRLLMASVNVEGFEDEPYSSSEASYPRLEYKLVVDIWTSGLTRLNTWNDAADLFYRAVYFTSGDDRKWATIQLNKTGDSKVLTTGERIRKIENYVKVNYNIRNDVTGRKYETIGGIVNSKTATDLGIMRLYAAMYGEAGIEIQIVMTSNRFQKRFDGDFDSWTYLQEFLIYFPETKGFIAPSALFSRYGFIPPELCGQDGMFISHDMSDNTRAGIIKWIDGTTWDKNMSTSNIRATFDLEKGLTIVNSTHSYTGHSGSFIQPYIEYMSSTDAKGAAKGILCSGAVDARPRNLVFSGYIGDDVLYLQPFIVSGEFTTNSFLEKTCDAYIFKVGEVIGMQRNLYDNEDRHSDVTLYYPYGIRREIVFEIPEGYKVTNLEALNIDVQNDSSEVSIMFHSSYHQTGNTISMLVEESYHDIKYPVAMYDDFAMVMNASADFNKVVLYFEKR